MSALKDAMKNEYTKQILRASGVGQYDLPATWEGFDRVAPRNLPDSLGWRRALEASAEPIDPQGWILAALG